MPAEGTTLEFESYRAALSAYVGRRVGDPIFAAGLVQDIYVRLAELPENTVLLNPRAHLFTVAADLIAECGDAWSVHSVPSSADDTAEGVAEPAFEVEADLLSRETLLVLLCAVETLPPRTREVLLLHRFEQLSYAEISAKLGIEHETVTLHMIRALTHCRNALRIHQCSAEQ